MLTKFRRLDVEWLIRWSTLTSGALIGLIMTCGSLSVAIAADEQPTNVLVILADDQGWGDVSFNGNPNISTPSIDVLARRGAIGEHFYVCPMCAPTRAEFLSGRYHPRGGVTGVHAGEERMSGDEITIAEILRDAGYATAAFGKWHNGAQWPHHPNAQGFEEFYGFTSGHWDSYFAPMLQHNDRFVRGTGYLPDHLTNRLIDFIRTPRDEPFFAFLALNTPHTPMQVPDDTFDPKDEIHWSVDVVTPGRSRATLRYAASLSQSGARITLVADNDQTSRRVDQPNEAPPYGMANDRVPRVEGPARDWAEIELGELTLNPGPQTLRLIASDIPDGGAGDYRMLILHR